MQVTADALTADAERCDAVLEASSLAKPCLFASEVTGQGPW